MFRDRSIRSYPTRIYLPTKEPNLSFRMVFHSSIFSECSQSVSLELAERAGWSRQNGALPRLTIFYRKTFEEEYWIILGWTSSACSAQAPSATTCTSFCSRQAGCSKHSKAG